MKRVANRQVLVAATAVAFLATLAGCASASSNSSESSVTSATSATPESGDLSGSLTVLAAASLTESFETIADEFTAANPSVDVTLSFGGSSELAAQIVAGSPADVFAAASPTTMATVTDASLAAGPATDFASNTLAIAVPKGNPGDVSSIDDLENPDLTLALCAAEVPCGSAANTLFEALELDVEADTYEQDVRGVLSKVQLDEVDAGLVYRTDVLAAGDEVESVEFDGAELAVNRYPIVRLTESAAPDAADAFVDFVLSEEGRAVLSDAGFGAP
jgi:molybdate transport system substrate-binding protein